MGAASRWKAQAHACKCKKIKIITPHDVLHCVVESGTERPVCLCLADRRATMAAAPQAVDNRAGPGVGLLQETLKAKGCFTRLYTFYSKERFGLRTRI